MFGDDSVDGFRAIFERSVSVGKDIFHFCIPPYENPAGDTGGVVCDYFLRTVNSAMRPAVIASRTPSGDFALTATLMKVLTLSISVAASNSAISVIVRLTNPANFRGVDFATWIESIFLACVKNCSASVARNFGVAVAGVAGVAVAVAGVADGVRFVAIFLYRYFRDSTESRLTGGVLYRKSGVYPE